MAATAPAPVRRLGELLAGCAELPGTGDLEVAGLTLDSRSVRRGDAFVALSGARGHGLDHARQALEHGAVVVLFEPPAPDGVELPDAAVAVPGLRQRLGELADRFHGQPSAALAITGVTGTNGKTSTVQLLAQALHQAGHRVGTLGTLGHGVHPELESGSHTTPDVLSVHRTLADMRAAGCSDVAMEVSSHALEQGRVDAVRFRVAVFTNLSRDHLDYHGSMAAYGAAKARLFDWPGLAAAAINFDDAFGEPLATRLAPGVALWSLSSRGHPRARLRADSLRAEPDGLAFDLVEGEARVAVGSRLLGRFNIDNLLAVAGALRALGFDLDAAARLLEALQPVPGRMSRIGGDCAPLVVVDYAHTPDALEQALASLREHARGRLLCLFGCGGDRDRGKRPLMASVAERLADVVMVSDDNPRTEDPEAIFDAIREGFAAPDRARFEHDRRQAIRQLVAEAEPGDVVLVAGKGHEAWQERAGQRRPFDDLAEARAALEGRA